MSRAGRLALAVVVLASAATALVAIAGCAPSKVDVAVQQKAQCFANEHQLKMAIDLVHADSGVYPDMADVLAQVHAVCPAGGTYTFDPVTDIVTCSVHGHL